MPFIHFQIFLADSLTDLFTAFATFASDYFDCKNNFRNAFIMKKYVVVHDETFVTGHFRAILSEFKQILEGLTCIGRKHIRAGRHGISTIPNRPFRPL